MPDPGAEPDRDGAVSSDSGVEPGEFDRIQAPRGERVAVLLTAFERLTGTRVRLTGERDDGDTILFNGFTPDPASERS